MEELLIAFLDSVNNNERAYIEKQVRKFIDVAYQFLEEWTKPIGKDGHNEFYEALNLHLSSAFPWAKDEALSAARSYTGWYAWHEGY